MRGWMVYMTSQGYCCSLRPAIIVPGYSRGKAESQEAAAAAVPSSKLPPPCTTQSPSVAELTHFWFRKKIDEKLLRVSPDFWGQCLALGTYISCS